MSDSKEQYRREVGYTLISHEDTIYREAIEDARCIPYCLLKLASQKPLFIMARANVLRLTTIALIGSLDHVGLEDQPVDWNCD